MKILLSAVILALCFYVIRSEIRTKKLESRLAAAELRAAQDAVKCSGFAVELAEQDTKILAMIQGLLTISEVRRGNAR